MNCQKFETVVSELARGQMMAAELRGEALAHSDACDDCALRLRDEQMLTRGLQSLAAEMDSLEAPAMIEANVLMAFRARKEVVAAPVPQRRLPSAYWLVAVAAMLLIAISVFVFRWTNRPVADPREAIRQEQPQEKPKVVENPAPQLVQDVVAPDDDVVPAPPKPRRNRFASLSRPVNNQVANHVTNEIATDFIPLSYMNAASLQDGGQIVRVQLPRSALVNFGLPVNMDRYNEKVKADVLFGVDGTARAIRFVQ
ncbi:MAG TPA: hypothetical protein VFI24_03625 [Pyrinomonadaceae bacterium]|nr:hypothetical protein [Pyrinomonadaceae bacterium]